MSDATETQTVRFELLGIQRVRDCGRLIALAVVEIDVAGVVIVLQGVQAIREGAGIVIKPPHHRAADGKLRPSIGLPRSLSDALAAEVREHFENLSGLTGAHATPGTYPQNRVSESGGR